MSKSLGQEYNGLLTAISGTFSQGKQKRFLRLMRGWWRPIGRLASTLLNLNNKGERFRQFYLANRNGATLSHHLSWSHY